VTRYYYRNITMKALGSAAKFVKPGDNLTLSGIEKSDDQF
jgi:hypothetical protein